MKTGTALLTAFLVFSGTRILTAAESSDTPIAEITVGIYHAISQGNPTTDFIKAAETRINSEVFGGKTAISFKVLFVKSLDASELAKYKIGGAFDIDGVVPYLDKIRDATNPNLYLTLLPSRMGRCYSLDIESLPEMKFVAGCDKPDILMVEEISGGSWENKILMSNFLQRKNNPELFMHELGHFLNLDHTASALCQETQFVMCVGFDNAKLVFDAQYKQAWREFYYQRTGQKPPQ